MPKSKQLVCDEPEQDQEQCILEKASVFAAVEDNKAAWTDTFKSIIQRGYVAGPIVDKPQINSIIDIENNAVPTIYLQLNSFIRNSEQGVLFDYAEMEVIAAYSVRMADNILNAFCKVIPSLQKQRRVAVVARGVKSTLLQLGYDLHDKNAWPTASCMMNAFKLSTYRASICLAAEKGSYPEYNYDVIRHSPNFRLLPEELQNDIKHFGLRNARLHL